MFHYCESVFHYCSSVNCEYVICTLKGECEPVICCSSDKGEPVLCCSGDNCEPVLCCSGDNCEPVICCSGERGEATAEGDNGSAENGADVVWKWVGCYPQVYLLRLFPPSSSTQGILLIPSEFWKFHHTVNIGKNTKILNSFHQIHDPLKH